MNLNDQVCSLELSKRLEQLGVDQESLFVWADYSSLYKNSGWEVDYRHECNGDGPAAFTVAELGEMLPQFSKSYFYQDEGSSEKTWMCNTDSAPGYNTDGDTEADARAKMLVYLIEQGIVNPKEPK